MCVNYYIVTKGLYKLHTFIIMNNNNNYDLFKFLAIKLMKMNKVTSRIPRNHHHRRWNLIIQAFGNGGLIRRGEKNSW